MVTLIALYNLYFHQLLATEPEDKAFLNESSTHLAEMYQRKHGHRKVPHQRLLLKLKAHDIRDVIIDWIDVGA